MTEYDIITGSAADSIKGLRRGSYVNQLLEGHVLHFHDLRTHVRATAFPRGRLRTRRDGKGGQYVWLEGNLP